MKKPKHVNVFGLKVRIKHVDMSDTRNLGVYDYEKKEIRIEQSLTGNAFWNVYFHECVHAMFDRLGYNQTTMTSNEQELFCEHIATLMSENINQ